MRVRIAFVAVSLALASVVAAPAAVEDKPETVYFVEVYVPSLERAHDLAAAGFDIAGIHRAEMAVGIVATAEEIVRLETFGWPVKVRQAGDDPLAIAALSDYTDPQELSAFMTQVQTNFPSIAQKVLLKDPLFEGQKQWAVKITKDVALPNDRPSFILDAQHHAREVMTPEVARDMIDYLTQRYATDPQVKRWVDNINIWVVGSVNPDGGMYVFTTNSNWRKNRHPSCAVDNNRNYPALWNSCNGSSGSCSSDTYRGASPGSEPETQGLMQLTSDVRPYFALSYHSYGEYLMYSYGCSDPDEFAALDGTAQALNAILENDQGVTGQYATGPIWSTIYAADGGSIDTQYAQYGAYSYVIEVNASLFQPDYATWRNVTVQRQRTAWQYFLNQTLDGPQIRGRVTDAATGLPLPATVGLAEVTFTHGESPRKANAKGDYRLLVAASSTNHLTVSHPGYCTVTQPVSVASGPAIVDVVLGQPAIPQGVAAAPGGDNAIDLSWQGAANAEQYRIYRSISAGGPYTLVASVAGNQTSYHDAPVSGGIPWFYVVRAVQGCESGNSTEVSAQTTGPCTVGPAFSGIGAAVNAAASTCAMNLSWPAAASRCGGAVTYRVHRSATAPFTPSASNLVAAGLTGTSFVDHDALASGARVHYVVRAVDAGNGTDDGNAVTVSGTPTGPDTVGTWTDDAGDNGAATLTPAAPWSIKPTGGKTGPAVYATGSYANNVCAALTTPPITLQSGSVLSFASKYDLETDYDAGIVEIATGPAFSTWTKLAINYPDRLAFTGNACGFPTSGVNTVFSRTNATPTYAAAGYSGSLAAYAGQSVKLRWRLSSDGGVIGAGFWVDDLAITNAIVPGACAPGTPSNPKEASSATALTAARGAGSTVTVAYAPACAALDHAAYWGEGPIAGGVVWTQAACGIGNTGGGSFDPGDPAPGSFFYFVVVGQNGAKEGSYGAASSGERPEAIGIGACDKPRDLTGSCP